MWGFQLVPLDARPTGSSGASSFFAEGGGDEETTILRGVGAGGWKLVGVPIVMGTQLGVAEFMDSLQELMAYAGARPPPPQAIRRVLVSKACRGAIMFGDKLSRRQCDQVVASLITCALPFQCAHGRPTLWPLLRLAAASQASAAADNGCHKGANAPPSQLPKHASSSAYDMHPPPQLPKPEWARWRSARRKGSK